MTPIQARVCGLPLKGLAQTVREWDPEKERCLTVGRLQSFPVSTALWASCRQTWRGRVSEPEEDKL